MNALKDRITPSIVISSLALFVALGGASYAALGKNTVGSKQLKKNAVVTKKIKKNAVTASKIKKNSVNSAKIRNGSVVTGKIQDDAVTGAKVQESSLGTVPEATHAGSADSATSASSATNAVNAANAAQADAAASLDGYQRLGFKRLTPSSDNPTYTTALAQATEVPLFDLGQAEIYAKCFKSGGTLFAAHYIKTSVDGAVFDSYYDYAYGSPGYLNVGTPEGDAEIFYATTGSNSIGYINGADPTIVLTPDGKSYKVNTAVYVKQGTPPGGNGPYGPGDTCVYLGDGGLN